MNSVVASNDAGWKDKFVAPLMSLNESVAVRLCHWYVIEGVPVTVDPVNNAGTLPAQTFCIPVIVLALTWSFILIVKLCSA